MLRYAVGGSLHEVGALPTIQKVHDTILKFASAVVVDAYKGACQIDVVEVVAVEFVGHEGALQLKMILMKIDVDEVAAVGFVGHEGALQLKMILMKDTANTIYTDSQSTLAIARNPVFHARTKHIEVHYHYVRERLSAGEISLAYVPTQNNLVDLFTKALSRENLEAFRKDLGLLLFVD
ncbi:hypothetical protein L7F22_006770 [Adiantum nelumboides]|nr:hypothetical protein [Adiantum nelumboides]